MAEKIVLHKTINSRILKIYDEERIIKGVVLEPDTVDLQDDIILANTIKEACYDYIQNSRIIGYRHQELAKDCSLVECYIADENQYYDNNNMVIKGSMVIAVKVLNDEYWKQIKNEELNSFSIGGWGERTPINDAQIENGDIKISPSTMLLSNIIIEEISIVVYGANNKKFICRKGENGNGTLWFIDKEKNGVVDMVKTDAEIETERLAKEKADADATIEADRIAKEKADAEKLEKEKNEANLSKEQKLERTIADLNARLEVSDRIAKDAMKKADTERTARLNKEFIDIAKETFPVMGDSKIVGPIIKECFEKLGKETYEALTVILKAANAQIQKSGLFIEVGKESDAPTDAYSQIDKLAKEYITANPTVNYSQALDFVLKTHGNLYNEYTQKHTRTVKS